MEGENERQAELTQQVCAGEVTAGNSLGTKQITNYSGGSNLWKYVCLDYINQSRAVIGTM